MVVLGEGVSYERGNPVGARVATGTRDVESGPLSKSGPLSHAGLPRS